MGQGQAEEPSEETPELYCCSPNVNRGYLRQVIHLIDIEDRAAGLSVGQYVDLVLAVDAAEDEEWKRDRPATPIGRKRAIELYLRFQVAGIQDAAHLVDKALRFMAGATARLVEESQIHPQARDVVAAHLQGDAPSRISRDLKVGVTTVTRILSSIGEEPNRARDLAPTKSADINQAIKRRVEDGWGDQQIADHLGISITRVKSRIQYLRRKGRLDIPPGARPGRNNPHRL